MKKYLLCLTLVINFSVSSADSNSAYLIKEMESLRDSLKLDDPARIDLTLRLADLYFDVSIMEGNKEDRKSLKANRMKALDLYRHTLNGTDGVQKATGLNRIKVAFQMARLLTRLDEREEAETYYIEVFENKKTPKKMKEQSSLALAEWYEDDAKYRKSYKYYGVAISSCEAKSICNYAHYRKAWLFYKDTKLNEAIEEMKLSLFDQDNNVRENSLTDLMLFMSNQEGDGMDSLSYIKNIAKKYDRPKLVRQLVEAYYVAGNRYAGSHLLADLNKNYPNLYYEVRLLEEFYGFRKWEKVEDYLGQVEKRTVVDIPSKKVEKEEVLKIMRRFIVQVDSETQVIGELKTFLKRSIDVYLTLYPNDKLRKQMQQGWLKAESDIKVKTTRLGQWIKEDIGYGKNPKDIRNLRQTRLSFAQKLKLQDIVIEDSLAIAEILKGTKEADEFTYVAAREMYSRKDYDKALPLFQGLVSNAVKIKKFSKWAILSQNLTLDIFNNKKDFGAIVAQVQLWKGATAGSTSKDVLKEKSSMDNILVEAEFEQATSMGESAESLKKFYDFCFKGVFPKKSCVNAKVLAVKLKDQAKVVSLLEKEGDEKALVIEYELMGQYTKAAKLNEKFLLRGKNSKNVPATDYMKIALLYELDQDYKSRNKTLTKLIRKIRKEKKIEKGLEGAIFLTLDEAGLIDTKSLTMPWTLSRKLKLSHRLQIEKPTKQSYKVLMSQKESQGPAWSKIVLGKLEKPYSKVSKIGFYGRYSQYKFKKRTKAIDKFVLKTKEYLDGSDLETRVYILHMLTATYNNMSSEIHKTPIPDGLDEATLKMVDEKLKAMAAPFEQVALDYKALLDKQLAALGEESKTRVLGNISGDTVKSYASFIQIEKTERLNLASVDHNSVLPIQKALESNPESLEALTNLKSFYEKNSSKRLAAYYNERLNGLKKVESKSI
jgi:hypothetical protein